MACLACGNIEELCLRLEQEGAAGLMIAEEVLVRRAFGLLTATLSRQESWSDVPILLFTGAAASSGKRVPSPQALAPLGNVTLLERPLQPITVLSAANSALRGRRRQYMARAELLAQHRAVQQRDQFLAMLGHELRNPLAAIALANSLDAPGQAAHARNVIGRQVRHLTRLVDDLLDVARVTSGKIALKRDYVDLVPLAEACIATLQPLFDAQQLVLRVVKPAAALVVFGDSVRLEQIIVNLLTNAAKYTPALGSVELTLRAVEDHALLEVRDSGVGIAPDMVERVFDLFAQAEASLDRSKGGLGIGLTLVRSLVELHGGSVEACSAGLGAGSTFRVRLPRVSAMRANLRNADVAATTADQRTGYDVLIVEDNADSRELLALVLERLGHRVRAAEDGLSGVQQALARRPDVLLVDIGLPGLDGYGVARRVRAALGPEVYMIALTGYGQPEDRQRALDAGFDAHFTKPLDVKVIDRLLNRSNLAACAAS
jgi:signal transduction histidine kinase/ActR/RegA family two-component response regulator